MPEEKFIFQAEGKEKMREHKEYIFLRDAEGFIRIEPVQMSIADIKTIIEHIYVDAGFDFKIKELNVTFSEYDKGSGFGSGGVKRKWVLTEKEYLLNHLEDDNDAIGAAIGRSGMAVYMQKPDILAEKAIWLEEHSEYIKLPRAEQNKKFLYGE